MAAGPLLCGQVAKISEAACVLVSEEPRWPLNSLCSKRKHNDLEGAAN